MLSIDCEMVICEGGEKELVRVCVVNSNCEMVSDMVVKRGSPVTDYLTQSTGISESDLDSATSSFFDAQEAVLNLMTKNTILIGHSFPKTTSTASTCQELIRKTYMCRHQG